MSAAVRDQINEMTKRARDIAMQSMLQPKAERDYLIACGKVQQLLADARELKERFLEPEQPDPERDLGEYPEHEAPSRRVTPQRDRVDASRARHRPRQM